MLRKTIYHLSVLLVTIVSFHAKGHADVQRGSQKGDFIVTAKAISLSPLAHPLQYACDITEPSILFKPKNKPETQNLTLDQFCSLWEKGHTFNKNAPNATLVFSDQQDNSYQMIFDIPEAHSKGNSLILTAAPLTPQGHQAFLKNNQPISAKDFIEGTLTAKKETISLLIDDADEPDYNNPWFPSS